MSAKTKEVSTNLLEEDLEASELATQLTGDPTKERPAEVPGKRHGEPTLAPLQETRRGVK